MKLEVGQIIFDKDGAEVKVIDLTSTSAQLYIKKKKATGIDSKDWYAFGKDFDNRFKTK